MSNKKQTAVDWLINELYPSISLQSKYIEEIKNKAKTIEKQQICESFAQGYLDFENTGRAMEVAEQYYQTTYEQ